MLSDFYTVITVSGHCMEPSYMVVDGAFYSLVSILRGVLHAFDV